jgi:transposase
MVTIGIDTHTATLAASAIDAAGRELDAKTFRNDRRGHAGLLRWAQALAPDRRFGIEGSGSYGAVLARLIVAAGEVVVEVPAILTRRERRHLHRAGKSDPGDALAIARVALREQGLGPVQLPGMAEDLKLLVDARDQRIGERTRAANRLHAYLVVLDPGAAAEIHNLTASIHLAAARRVIGRRSGTRAELARSEWVRVRALSAEVVDLEGRIRALVRVSGSNLPTIRGVAAITTAKLLGETGDPRRFRSSPAFASLTGTAPIPASSGKTSRHRLNRGGNRQLNRAIHTIAVAQARSDPLAQAYVARRMADGKSRLEALRCLKRHLADVVFRTMVADAVADSQFHIEALTQELFMAACHHRR